MEINITRLGAHLGALSAVISSAVAVIVELTDLAVFVFCALVALVIALENIDAMMDPESSLQIILATLCNIALILIVPAFLLLALFSPYGHAMAAPAAVLLILALVGSLSLLFCHRDEA